MRLISLREIELRSRPFSKRVLQRALSERYFWPRVPVGHDNILSISNEPVIRPINCFHSIEIIKIFIQREMKCDSIPLIIPRRNRGNTVRVLLT